MNVLINAINKIFENLKIRKFIKKFYKFFNNKKKIFCIEQILNNFIEICSEKRGELKLKLNQQKNYQKMKLIKLKMNYQNILLQK